MAKEKICSACGKKKLLFSKAKHTTREMSLQLCQCNESYHTKVPYDFGVQGFEEDILNDQEKIVGGFEDFSVIRTKLGINENKMFKSRDRVFWLTGPAGIGKSCLLSLITVDLLDDLPKNTLVLPYRFEAGDDRCSQYHFLCFAIERIALWKQYLGMIRRREEPVDALKDILACLGKNRVIFILDGLERIIDGDAGFIEEVPWKNYPSVIWVCAGRAEGRLPEIFEPERCCHLFPYDVPPTTVPHVGGMILDKIDPVPHHTNLPGDGRKESLMAAQREAFFKAVLDYRIDDEFKAFSNFNNLMKHLMDLPGSVTLQQVNKDWHKLLVSRDLSANDVMWEKFLWANKPMFLRGNDEWPAYKILLQLALEAPDDSLIKQSARKYLATSDCNWLRLQEYQPEESHPEDGAVIDRDNIFNAERKKIIGYLDLGDGKVFIWGNDSKLTIHEFLRGTCLTKLKGHSREIINAKQLSDSELITWSHDGFVIIWDIQSGECLFSYRYVDWYDRVDIRAALSDATVIQTAQQIWNHSISTALEDEKHWNKRYDRSRKKEEPKERPVFLKIVDPKTCEIIKKTVESSESAYGFSFILESTTGWMVYQFSIKSIFFWKYLQHEEPLKFDSCGCNFRGAVEINDGSIATWVDKTSITIWSLKESLSDWRPEKTLDGHIDTIDEIAYLGTNWLASRSCDGTDRLWNTLTGECICVKKSSILPLKWVFDSLSGIKAEEGYDAYNSLTMCIARRIKDGKSQYGVWHTKNLLVGQPLIVEDGTIVVLEALLSGMARFKKLYTLSGNEFMQNMELC